MGNEIYDMGELNQRNIQKFLDYLNNPAQRAENTYRKIGKLNRLIDKIDCVQNLQRREAEIIDIKDLRR